MHRLLAIAAVLALAACDRPSPPRSPSPAAPPEPAVPAAPAPPAAPNVPLPPAPAAPDADSFDALGTEPFWALKIRPDGIVLSSPAGQAWTGRNPGVDWQGKARTWQAHSGAGPLTIVITPGECSDGMSDRAYPYAAEVTVGHETLKGCASRAGKR
jgi:uncharacterized membrane protein